MDGQIKHTLRIAHWQVGDPDLTNPAREEELTDVDVRRLRFWLDQALKTDDCQPARKLLAIVNHTVWAQAFEQGYADAQTEKVPRLAASAHPLWKDGYEFGFAIGKSDDEAA